MKSIDKELNNLRKYLTSPGTEKAKDYLVFPLFQSLFARKFKKETDAEGADIYIEGKLIVELKSDYKDFLQGFYQALHYAKLGLSFSAICVITQKFVGVWKVNDIPDFSKKLLSAADASTPPNMVGTSCANRTTKAQSIDILKSSMFKLRPEDLEGFFEKNFDTSLHEFVQLLTNLDAERVQINTHNFIDHIEQLEKFFDDPLQAIHCFYAMVGFWDTTSRVAFSEQSDGVRIFGRKGTRYSEDIPVKPHFHEEFKKFVESRYVFTNEGSGLTVDYYFSRFDEVITRVKPEYAKQHGIFFTDNNLSKFALWFVHQYFENRLSDKYIVLDPAGGSGNLVTSWRGHIKHKIVSELQPDLLKTIERRMTLDPEQIQEGFTIIPKTSKNEGLNFLDKPAEKYVSCLIQELEEMRFKFDKPIAFLLNPPYKNTDENVDVRIEADATYSIDPSILELTGNDAGKERYLAFLGQIVNISRVQMGDLIPQELNFENIKLPKPLDTKKVETPLILIFTPTSWLVPRPSYVKFREIFDRYFKFEMGFIFLGNEFFKIQGRFPISFTIWSYRRTKEGNANKVVVRDLTHLKHDDLEINWNLPLEVISRKLKSLIRDRGQIHFDNSRGDIRRLLPKLADKNGKLLPQPRYDFSVAKDEDDYDKIVSGFPSRDKENHFELSRKCGEPKGNFVGFMDDNTPVRVPQDTMQRMSSQPDRVWFRLDLDFKGANKTRIQGGCPDNRGYCAYDLASARATFLWFAITKSLNSRYPIWANQFDIWAPRIPIQKEKQLYSLCFSFGVSENRCVVTKFEKDNPVKGAPEIIVDNPLCPTNAESFWSKVLDKEIVARPAASMELVTLVRQLYKKWNLKYCKGGILRSIGLHEEPYFKFFDYKDFLTPYAGLIQIKKYAELHNASDLLEMFDRISEKSKEVREIIYSMLVEDFKYFD